MNSRATFCLLGFFLFGCAPAAEQPPEAIQVDFEKLKNYWYGGKAELTKYNLRQARYGEVHEGHAVLIYVTENFLADAQTKQEFGSDEAYSVLKLNATKKFLTGLYPYSTMASVFTKMDRADPVTTKISFSAQEWCGHAYMQLNRRGGELQGTVHSYFQRVGDQNFSLPDALTEDGIWTLMRIAPDQLPTGKITLVPSLEHQRMNHSGPETATAEASLAVTTDPEMGDGNMFAYKLVYEAGRTLTIFFQQEAPYAVKGWREDLGRGLVTTAIASDQMITDYWSKNRNADRELRRQLGLE